MIERVARAIYDGVHDQCGGRISDEDWFEIWRWHTDQATVNKGGVWEIFRAAVKAIQAMREPTEAMVDSGDLYTEDPRNASKYVWQAMIDEALK